MNELLSFESWPSSYPVYNVTPPLSWRVSLLSYWELRTRVLLLQEIKTQRWCLHFVHNSIKFTSLDIDNYCLNQDFEASAIHLNSKHEKLCILVAYRSPRENFNTFLTKFDRTLQKFYTHNFSFIICGDINVDYLTVSTKKNQLDRLLQSNNLVALLTFLLE
jgi:exonuclease III